MGVVGAACIFILYKKLMIPGKKLSALEKNVDSHPALAKSVEVAQQNPPVQLPVSSDVEDMRQNALTMNFAQTITNLDQFGEHSDGAPILVVQVHDRATFFAQLVNSLKNVKGIEQATLVISMDQFSKEVDEVISSIDFCRYLKIFFPFSKQLYPNSFPGEDPNDCPRDLSKHDAIQRRCNNAEYPDMYGHYREVKFVQIKHHWLWKLHMLFSGIRAFKGSTSVLLLEEDYYVAPDLLHCLAKAVELKDVKCSRCQTISLGNYKEHQDYSLQGNHVEIKAWTSSAHNIGMVVTRGFYNQIVDCTDKICEYDDYNWDWSLQAAASCIPGSLFTIAFNAARVFHIGTCGIHNHEDCHAAEAVKGVTAQLQNAQLFPETLHVALDSAAVAPQPRPNGGWGDARDHLLCKKYKTLCEKSAGL